MLTAHTSGAISNFQTYLEAKTLQEACSYKVTYVSPVISTVISPIHGRGPGNAALQSSSFSSKSCTRLKIHHISHPTASKKWLCRFSESMSSDDEYRSSRNIAISLFRRYRNFIERGGGDNLKEFISAGVNAYALGCTDEGLRKELIDMKESGFEIEAMQNYGGSTSLKSKIFSEEHSIYYHPVYTTANHSSMVINASGVRLKYCISGRLLCYHSKCILCERHGMAISSKVKTLQLEQMAVVGQAEEPSVVASRMRLVFSTLEVVSPQWPRV
ncbi:hypothetical protein HYC85_007121 [Camellia sinensis]|uniref:DUF7876 domain-containing protein n=1 Tax=Camellia sinensis TaxID=4442 RepID=A0A7J7HNZ6_CAMSI|nr:hypothetical protein HYC85_007121 [Camellia sinensis]